MEHTLGDYRVWAATEYGPRITALRRGDDSNLLAELSPDVTVGPSDDPYRFMGGHRVWAAPEVPEITYAPDGRPCTVTESEGTLRISAGPDRVGVAKEIAITAEGSSLVVASRLTCTRDLGHSIAPWAITQLPLGGVAIVPVVGADTTPQANRRLVLWPYTTFDDPRLALRGEVVLIEASGIDPVKVGTGPSPSALGYWRAGRLFMKEVPDDLGENVPDMGAVAQVYVGSGFCELETMGGLAQGTEGAVIELEERWSVIDCPDLETAVGVTMSAAR